MRTNYAREKRWMVGGWGVEEGKREGGKPLALKDKKSLLSAVLYVLYTSG